MEKLLLVTVLFVVSAITNAANGCGLNTCANRGLLHTLIAYPVSTPSSTCGKVLSVGFTAKEQDEIVRKHNELRQYVARGEEKRGNPGPQPPARNMQTMVWDSQLACVAQRWANQCDFSHDPCRDDPRFYVGQNIAMTATTGTMNTTPSDIVMMWYNEVSKMDRNQVNRLTNINGVGHYTQVVWANTNKIGCGKIVYQPDNWKKYYVVCNYGPGGNYMQQPIYQTA